MKYKIYYDYSSALMDYEDTDLEEEFEGTHAELLDYIKAMRREGCYNIEAVAMEQD